MLGPPKPTKELTWGVGALWAWGQKSETSRNPFHSLVENQTGLSNSLAYSFRAYKDGIGTSQLTGVAGVELGKWQFTVENDAFSGVAADKFRTAAACMRYRLPDGAHIGLETILWTGDPFTDMIDTKTRDNAYPGRYGYRDMSHAHYGRFSHGILAMLWQQALPYGQTAKAEAGIDSEWVRHFLQNIIIHDLYILPDCINPAKMPHIPMVADDGTQFLFREGQKVRPARFFGQVSLNGDLFY